MVLLNAIDNPVLRLLRVEPKDEITPAFTREEVAAAHRWAACWRLLHNALTTMQSRGAHLGRVVDKPERS